jgi:hypothetical protein
MPTYADTILSTILMGAGAVLVDKHILSSAQLAQAVAALMVLIAIAWSAVNADPNRQSPIAFLLGLVRQAPPADQDAYDAALEAAQAAILAKVTPMIHAELKARLGLFSGPADAIADTAAKAVAGEAVAAVETPHLAI